MKTAIMKLVRAFGAAALMAAILGAPAAAQEKKPATAAKGPAGKQAPKLSEKDQKAADGLIAMFNEKLKHRYAPQIKSVTTGPAQAGKPITVTIKAGYDTASPIDKIKEAEVYYFFEGADELKGPVALKASGANTFTGAIPAPGKSGKMYVIPRVRDTYGNVGTEFGCKVSTWPPEEDPCMVVGAIDADPSDDPAALIEDDFDIWDFKIGTDDKYVYMMIDVEGDIAKGTMNPPHINMYLSMLVDTKALAEISDITVFMAPDASEKFKDKMDKAAMVVYSPLAPSIDNKIKACFIPRPGDKKDAAAAPAKQADPKAAPAKGEDAKKGSGGGGGGFGGGMLDSQHVKCKADGSTLYTRVEKSILSKTMQNSFSAMGSLNGFVNNPQMPLPTLREILPITNVSWNPHVVNVK